MTNRDLGHPLAQGATAEIYAWQPGLVLKLFRPGFGPGAVEYEARIARAVQAAGLPVPAVGEIVQVNGRCGLVYQRLAGQPLTAGLRRRPWRVDRIARRMAELQAEMHAAPFQGRLPTQRERLCRKIIHSPGLDERLRKRVLAVLARLPDGDRLCHGDFHPENILLEGRKEIIIDWVDATAGSAPVDVARTTIILLGAAESDLVATRGDKLFIRRFHQVYLRRYFRLRPGGEKIYRAALPVVAAARLSENIGPQAAWLMAQVDKLA